MSSRLGAIVEGCGAAAATGALPPPLTRAGATPARLLPLPALLLEVTPGMLTWPGELLPTCAGGCAAAALPTTPTSDWPGSGVAEGGVSGALRAGRVSGGVAPGAGVAAEVATVRAAGPRPPAGEAALPDCGPAAAGAPKTGGEAAGRAAAAVAAGVSAAKIGLDDVAGAAVALPATALTAGAAGWAATVVGFCAVLLFLELPPWKSSGSSTRPTTMATTTTAPSTSGSGRSRSQLLRTRATSAGSSFTGSRSTRCITLWRSELTCSIGARSE